MGGYDIEFGRNAAAGCEWPWPWLWLYSVAPRVISVSSVGSVVPERRLSLETAGRTRQDAEHEGRTTLGRHSGGNNATEGGQGTARRLLLSLGSVSAATDASLPLLTDAACAI